MKKVMFAAAVAAGMVAFGDAIESANVVGYQDRGIGSFNLTLGTFVNASGAESVLGDIKPNATFIANGTIQPFTAAGKAGPVYVYVNDPDALDAFEADEGWYLLTDDELTSPKNSQSFPFGTGFVSKSTASGSTLTYSGEVKGTTTEIPVGGFTLTGNCSPKDLTLADFTPNATFIANGTIQPFTAAGKAGPVYVYVNDPDALDAFEADEGWYLLTDDELTTPKNSETINAGDAFVAKSTASGATLTIPSAK